MVQAEKHNNRALLACTLWRRFNTPMHSVESFSRSFLSMSVALILALLSAPVNFAILIWS
jgi:hypothetical protein